MISQPMNGLTRAQIEANRAKVVARLEAMGAEIVDSFVTEEPPPNANAGLFCLGKSFQIMATVDAVYFMEGWTMARGCCLEWEACKRYGIHRIDQPGPDAE
jgi:hypothetical protein